MISLFKSVREDIAVIFEPDPAARAYLEVRVCYPGRHVLWAHRLNRWLWQRSVRFAARFHAAGDSRFTVIQIHPGAEIGRRWFIDHGMAW